MGLFSKRLNEQKVPPSERPPVILDDELADADRIMDRWDNCMSNSDAMWDCLELIGRRGGYKGGHATLMETMDGASTEAILQRPWRWWEEAARAANLRGRSALTARIFLFTHLFVTQLAPRMNAGSELDTGLVKPAERHYQAIAALAVDAMAALDRTRLIHDTSTSRVDVASALAMAEQVSGITAPAAVSSQAPPPPPVVNDGSQWNRR